HLVWVAVGQPLNLPHLGLVEAAAHSTRMTRQLAAALRESREHVPAHGVGAEVGLLHCVEHLGGASMAMVARWSTSSAVSSARSSVSRPPKTRFQAGHVADSVKPLPASTFPLAATDSPEAGQSTPVRFDERAVKRIAEYFRARRSSSDLPNVV